jgi:hypothetical protein
MWERKCNNSKLPLKGWRNKRFICRIKSLKHKQQLQDIEEWKYVCDLCSVFCKVTGACLNNSSEWCYPPPMACRRKKSLQITEDWLWCFQTEKQICFYFENIYSNPIANAENKQKRNLVNQA